MRITKNCTWTDGERWLSEVLGLRESDTPFPWQRKLLRCFSQGKIPGHLDIPTGLGKTSVMAIWLVARALGADLPRRLVYVVDRRAVVDQSTDVALQLRRYVDRNPEFKAALGLSGPLPISTLRGQHVDNREWLQDPTLPAIIVGTVDMIGSRLLFEGYGTSRKMRPYQAGLLGSDVLVALDEAHLVPPFEKLLKAIATGASTFGPQDGLAELIPPFRLMTLTATAHSNGGNPFGLTPEDSEHEVAKRRLHATKRLRLEPLTDPKKLPETLAVRAWELADKGRSAKRLVVFCDKPKDAETARAEVKEWAKGNKKLGIAPRKVNTELFVGGRRVYEREGAAERLKEHGFIPGSEEEPEAAAQQTLPGFLPDAESRRKHPAFVFATSAGEVGVDMDADHMVCDLVAWERMVQRLGRVNRRGEGSAEVVVVHAEQDSEDTPQLNALKCLPQQDGVFDASPEAFRSLRERAETDPALKQILDDASTKPPLRPALSRALVDAWSMTSLEKHTGRPDVQPWLRGWDEDPPQTTVVWRKYLPVRKGESPTTKKEIKGYFEAAPPHLSEKLETYTSEVVAWLEKRANALLKAPVGEVDSEAMAPNDTAAIVLNAAGEMKDKFPLEDLDVGRLDTKARGSKRKELTSLLTGATFVVDARMAGLSEGGRLDNKVGSPPRTADDGIPWLPSDDGTSVTRFSVRKETAAEDEQPDTPATKAGWRQRFRLAIDLSEEGEERQWLVVYKWRGDASMEDDRSIGAGPPQLLDEHQQWAGDCARAIAEKVGLRDGYPEMLAAAARLHDEGKRARRWQRAFNAPQDGDYAKTRGPINFQLLGGYRHEFGSLAHVERNRNSSLAGLPNDLCDLALHLVASHHGFARPVIRVEGCEDAPPSALEERAREVALRFARLQKRWGPWGLAWWEALLRSADWQASRDNEQRDKVNTQRDVS